MREELLGVASTVLVEEEEKSFVCHLIPTILTVLEQLHPFTPFYMVENTTHGVAHTMTWEITMLPVLSAWLPPELQ